MQSTEEMIQAKGLTAPRITPADIEANIASEHYFTAAQGDAKAQEDGAFVNGSLDGAALRAVPQPLHLLTFCVLVMQNGFTVTGESACASPENFDAEIGRKIAREKAVQKIWPLMGYELRSKLHAVNTAVAPDPVFDNADHLQPHQQRVVAEKAELDDRLEKLIAFFDTDTYKALPFEEQDRLSHQGVAMREYSAILGERIAAFIETR